MGFEIEKSIIDGDIEKKGLYTEQVIDALHDRLDTIIYQIDILNIQIQLGEYSETSNNPQLVEDYAKLISEKRTLEEEKARIEQELQRAKEQSAKESEELESADSFNDTLTEELFSARDIGMTTVPKALTTDKKKARKIDDEYIKSDSELSAQQINDGFKDRAESMSSKLDDLFR